MASSRKSEEDSKKVMDVNAPGKSAPDASSRPVIVSHKPMMDDPMMTKASSASETPTAPPLNSRGKTIQPLGARPESPVKSVASKPKTNDTKDEPVSIEPPAEEKLVAANEQTEETPVEASEDKDVAPDEKSEEAANPKEPEQKKPTAEPAKTAAPDAEPVDEQEEKKKQLEAQEAAEQAAAEKYEKLVADKTYFVPLDQSVSSSAGGKVLLVILALLVLAVAGAVLALDAGLIDADIDLPFDLIQNET